jgi:hypothetical protein
MLLSWGAGMKLSEIRPCDSCGGKIAPIFYQVRVSMAFFKERAVNATLGLNQIFGGRALALAEAMSPDPECVVIASDQEPSLETVLILCQNCYCSGVNLAMLAESRSHAKEEKA